MIRWSRIEKFSTNIASKCKYKILELRLNFRWDGTGGPRAPASNPFWCCFWTLPLLKSEPICIQNIHWSVGATISLKSVYQAQTNTSFNRTERPLRSTYEVDFGLIWNCNVDQCAPSCRLQMGNKLLFPDLQNNQRRNLRPVNTCLWFWFVLWHQSN